MKAHKTAGPVYHTQHLVKVLDTERLIRVGFFHTKPGYGVIREKGSLDWLLMYTTKGSGEINTGQGVFCAQPGDFVLLPQGIRHDYRIAPENPEWELFWCHFLPRSHWQILLNWPSSGAIRYLKIDSPALRKILQKTLKEMNDCYSYFPVQNEDFAMNALERILLLCSRENPSSQQARIELRIRKVMESLCEKQATRFNIQDIASKCGLSVSRLFHLFREQVGTTPIDFLEQHRINHAKELLEISHYNVSEIAYQSGFTSQAYFSRRFVLRVGVSPSEYRRQFRVQPAVPGSLK